MTPAIELGAPCPITIMKFTLTYEGELNAASARKTRLAEKWDIRRRLHPQLAELWQVNPVLKSLETHRKYNSITDQNRFRAHPLSAMARAFDLSPNKQAADGQ